MRVAQTVTLLVATLTVGLVAGLMAAFGYAVMPALRRSGDNAFVEVMRNINKAILNPLFLFLFLGGLVFSVLTAALRLVVGGVALWWVIAGIVLYAAALVISRAVNIPLNDRLEVEGEQGLDPAEMRDRFERRWVTANVLRAVAGTAAFGCLAWALVLDGAAG